jgi:hypothetical protein
MGRGTARSAVEGQCSRRQIHGYDGMTPNLIPFAENTDPAEFAAALAPRFGGDEALAHEILEHGEVIDPEDGLVWRWEKARG